MPTVSCYNYYNYTVSCYNLLSFSHVKQPKIKVVYELKIQYVHKLLFFLFPHTKLRIITADLSKCMGPMRNMNKLILEI